MLVETISIWKKYILLINLEGCVIIDTGPPMSFHRSGVITFAGTEHICTRTLPGIDTTTLSNELDQHVVGLIGMDIMSKYGSIIFDYPNCQLLIGYDIDETTQTLLPSGNIMGASYIDLTIEGKNAQLFMDTGAPTSYISSSFTNGHEELETTHDYHPFYGEFISKTYELTIKVNGQSEKIIFGNLPSILQMPISMTGADGVIGYDFFNNHRLLYKQSKWFIL